MERKMQAEKVAMSTAESGLSEPKCPFSDASPGSIKVGSGSGKRPPRIKCLPFVGPIKPFTGDVMPFLNETRKAYGEAFRFPIMGNELTILCGDDALALLEHDELLSTTRSMEVLARAVKSKLTYTFDGPNHKYYRKIHSGWLNRQLEKERRNEIVTTVGEHTANWKPGHVFDPLKEAQSQTVDVLSRILNGEPFPFTSKELSTVVHTLIFATYGHVPLWLALNNPVYKKTQKKMNENSLKLVRRVRQDPEFAERTLIGQYLKVEPKEDLDGVWRDDDLKIVPIAAYLAGYDTVASAAAFMLYQLLAHPEWLQKVRAEYDELTREADSAGVDPMKQKVLRAIFMEATRINPPGALVIRYATKDFQFKGYTIRKGDEVIVQISSNHMNEALFPNPEKFDPTRFLGDDATQLKRKVLTFGSGAHRCTGAMVGPLFSQEMVSYWVNHFDLELVPGNDKPRIVAVPFTQPMDLKVRVTGRR
ncbi:MAG: cytochrome P450 [Pseudomonadales bacterium]|nr:cytochrome P450 [Pseudomonadales bacterium]